MNKEVIPREHARDKIPIRLYAPRLNVAMWDIRILKAAKGRNGAVKWPFVPVRVGFVECKIRT